MSSPLLVNILRTSILRRPSIIRYFGHDSHGPNMPPFGRLRPSISKLHEEIELVWDDSVAPETCIDFDAQHVSSDKVFISFFTAFGSLLLLYGFVKLYDPTSCNPVAPRSSVINHSQFRTQLGVSGGSGEDQEVDDEDD